MSKFCENCGAKLADDAKFCEECGTKILPMSQVPPQFDQNQRPGNTGSFGNGPQYPEQNYQAPEQGAQQPGSFNNYYPGNDQNQAYGDSAPGAQQPGSFNNFNQNGAPNQGYNGFEQQQNQYNNPNGMQNRGYVNSGQQQNQYNNQNDDPNRGYAPAPGGPKKSGIPKVAIIGGVALVAVAAVGAFLVLGKIKGGQKEEESVAEETYVDYDQSSTETTSGVKSDTQTSGGTGGLSAREQASALDAALSNGSMADASQLNEETEASERNYDSYQEETKDEDTEQNVSSSDTVNTDMIGRKAKEIAENKSSDSSDNSQKKSSDTKQEIPTVTGGKWIQVAATWLYEKNNEIVKNSWIETDGVYYYVDEDGYMLEDAYTPDGYYVGSDGAYDPNASENKGVSGSSKNSSMSSSSDDEEFLPSTFAKKAKRDILQDGTVMYMNSVGDYVASVWVQDSDNGKYYYTGPDGCMIKDNYSADGYWCGSDGQWDKSVKQRNEDPEPKTGTYEGFVATWKVKITNDSKYGTATHTYTEFGGTPQVYDLTPVGHGVYIAENEYGTIAYMSVTNNGKTLIVSEAGITEECTFK